MDFARKWITTKNVFLLIIAVVLLTFGYLGTREYEKWLLNDNREKVSETLQIYQRSIESILIRRLGLVNGLDRFVVSRGDKEIEKDFLVFAPGLHNDFEGVRNVGIAPQGVLTLIYPLRGNEQAMGYNLLTDETPSVKSDVSRAIETGDVVVSDPFQLRQGGLGIAARKTIYKNGKLWGLVSVVVDVPTVIDYSGLVKGSENLDLSLRDKTGKVFWGNEKIFENNPVIQKIVTVDGYWELGGIGLGGWSSSIRSTLNIFVLFVWTLGVLIWLLISLLLKKEISLIISEEKISERTKSLRIVAVYLVVGVAWIFFSDRALLYVFTSPELINQLQTIKGWLFVLISSLIIYWLIEINYGRYLVTSRALRSVLASSRLLALAETEKYLYQGICDALVKEGGYVMAWVGLVEKNKNGLIKQIAVAGKSEGFLDELKITMTRAIGERTPCSMAITSGKPVIINDIDEVKDYPEWRLAAEKRGYRALIAIPLKENGKPFGLIGIYSNKTNVFSYGDLEVLSSYASDLVFGLRTLQLRTSRTEAEVKLEKLYTSMAEGVAFYEYVRDKKNRIVNYTILDANPAYKHHSGIDPDFVKGKLVTEVFGVKKPPYLKEYTDIIKTKKPVVFETYFSPLDRYFYVSAVYLGQDRFSTIFQDITERKNIENSLAKTNKEIHSQKQKLEVILRDMGDAVFVTDTEKKVVLVNRAMENLFGLAEKEMMGKSIEEVMMLSYESSGKKPDDLIKTVFDKKKPARPVETLTLNRKNGVKLSVDGVATPLVDENEKLVGTVWIFRDVTKERELTKLRSEFVSLASHQLRSPLTGIKWFVQLLLDEVEKMKPMEVKQYVEKIGSSNEKLIDLVNDLLITSRIDEGKYDTRKLEKVKVKELLGNAILQESAPLRMKNITIEGLDKISDALSIEGDSVQLIQVFSNLLDNAVNYSPYGSKVKIGVKKLTKEIVLSIQDRGMGIPNSQQKKIFEKFFRADNVAKTIPGSGLGLYMAINIVEGHGGKIWFESKENKGTTFFVKLPIKQKNG